MLPHIWSGAWAVATTDAATRKKFPRVVRVGGQCPWGCKTGLTAENPGCCHLSAPQCAWSGAWVVATDGDRKKNPQAVRAGGWCPFGQETGMAAKTPVCCCLSIANACAVQIECGTSAGCRPSLYLQECDLTEHPRLGLVSTTFNLALACPGPQEKQENLEATNTLTLMHCSRMAGRFSFKFGTDRLEYFADMLDTLTLLLH